MRFKSLLFLALIPAFITGCGGGGGGGGDAHDSTAASSKLAASESCMTSCHKGVTSPVTGLRIADEWRGSIHSTRNAAGCADCHEPTAAHLSCNKCHGGGGSGVARNPDQSGKCSKCHGPAFPDDVMMALAPRHYGYSTARLKGEGVRASYVSGQYQGRCRACHNPHNNNLTQHRNYAKSAHGDPKGVAWTSRDFKANAGCIRCHTTTGFKQFIASNFTVPTQGFGAGDASREVVACDACHASFDNKKSLRSVPAFTAPYTVRGTAATFPDAGTSNLCIPCHAGRASADNVMAIKDFTDAGFVNAHYFAAAGLMYMKLGFTTFTTATAPANAAAPSKPQYTYGDSYTMYMGPVGPTAPPAPPGQVNSAHRRFGTPLMNGDTHTKVIKEWIPGTMDTGGPCVTCHLNAHDSNGLLTTNSRTTSHTLAINDNTWKQVCINCHGADGSVAALIEENSADFQEALTLARQVLLVNYNIKFDGSRFYDLTADPTGKTTVRDWTRGTRNQAFGRRVMGACFNIHLLTKDPAAYAHARTYARRLLYDSIDFLDDSQINMSVGATALGPIGQTIRDENGNYVFVKGDTNATSSPAYAYLCSVTPPERR